MNDDIAAMMRKIGESDEDLRARVAIFMRDMKIHNFRTFLYRLGVKSAKPHRASRIKTDFKSGDIKIPGYY